MSTAFSGLECPFFVFCMPAQDSGQSEGRHCGRETGPGVRTQRIEGIVSVCFFIMVSTFLCKNGSSIQILQDSEKSDRSNRLRDWVWRMNPIEGDFFLCLRVIVDICVCRYAF